MHVENTPSQTFTNISISSDPNIDAICATIATHVFYDTFASPTIATHVFYDTFASPTIETHVFYDTFASPTTFSKLPERPLAAQGQKNEFPHDNFNCRSHFFARFEFFGDLQTLVLTSPTIETHVFYDTFASPPIETHVFYYTF